MAYGYYAQITIDETKVDETDGADLSNFPVMISGTYDGTGGEPDLRTTGNGGNIQNTDASGGASGSYTVPADLVFSASTDGSSPYDHEIEKYDASTGEIVAWVEIPTLDYNDDTVLYMVYGDSGVTTSQEDVNGTWNSNFIAVWHLNEYSDGSGAVTRYDSTSNGNNLTDNNTTASRAGKIDLGGDFVAADNTYLEIADGSHTGLDLDHSGQDFTVENWMNRDATGLNFPLSKDDVGANRQWDWYIDASHKSHIFYQDGSNNTTDIPTDNAVYGSTGTWYHSVMAVDTGTPSVSFFIDGSSSASTGGTTNATSIKNAGAAVRIGNAANDAYDIDGILDEMRVYNKTVTTSWAVTSYNTQNHAAAAFYSMGAEQSAASRRYYAPGIWR